MVDECEYVSLTLGMLDDGREVIKVFADEMGEMIGEESPDGAEETVMLMEHGVTTEGGGEIGVVPSAKA